MAADQSWETSQLKIGIFYLDQIFKNLNQILKISFSIFKTFKWFLLYKLINNFSDQLRWRLVLICLIAVTKLTIQNKLVSDVISCWMCLLTWTGSIKTIQLCTNKTSKPFFVCKLLNQWNHSANVTFWNAPCVNVELSVFRTVDVIVLTALHTVSLSVFCLLRIM